MESSKATLSNVEVMAMKEEEDNTLLEGVLDLIESVLDLLSEILGG